MYNTGEKNLTTFNLFVFNSMFKKLGLIIF